MNLRNILLGGGKPMNKRITIHAGVGFDNNMSAFGDLFHTFRQILKHCDLTKRYYVHYSKRIREDSRSFLLNTNGMRDLLAYYLDKDSKVEFIKTLDAQIILSETEFEFCKRYMEDKGDFRFSEHVGNIFKGRDFIQVMEDITNKEILCGALTI